MVARVEFRRLEIQDRGYQDDAVEIHAIALLEIAGKARGAGCAVAFAREKFRRRPALVARGIEPDEIRDGLDVFRHTVKLFRRFSGNGAAIAGPNAIAKDEIADVEQR